MPKLPAAFSPLMTTRSSFHSAISPGRRSLIMVRPDRPTISPMNKSRTRDNTYRKSITSFSVSTKSRRSSRSVEGTCGISARQRQCRWQRLSFDRRRGERHVVIARAIADAVAGAVESGKWHDDDVGRDLGRFRQRLADAPLPGLEGVAEIPGPHDQRMPASGDARQRQLRARSCEFLHQGTGLISVFIAEKPETMVPGVISTGAQPRGDRFGRRLSFGRRHRVALGKRLRANG